MIPGVSAKSPSIFPIVASQNNYRIFLSLNFLACYISRMKIVLNSWSYCKGNSKQCSWNAFTWTHHKEVWARLQPGAKRQTLHLDVSYHWQGPKCLGFILLPSFVLKKQIGIFLLPSSTNLLNCPRPEMFFFFLNLNLVRINHKHMCWNGKRSDREDGEVPYARAKSCKGVQAADQGPMLPQILI